MLREQAECNGASTAPGPNTTDAAHLLHVSSLQSPAARCTSAALQCPRVSDIDIDDGEMLLLFRWKRPPGYRQPVRRLLTLGSSAPNFFELDKLSRFRCQESLAMSRNIEDIENAHQHQFVINKIVM